MNVYMCVAAMSVYMWGDTYGGKRLMWRIFLDDSLFLILLASALLRSHVGLLKLDVGAGHHALLAFTWI